MFLNGILVGVDIETKILLNSEMNNKVLFIGSLTAEGQSLISNNIDDSVYPLYATDLQEMCRIINCEFGIILCVVFDWLNSNELEGIIYNTIAISKHLKDIGKDVVIIRSEDLDGMLEARDVDEVELCKIANDSATAILDEFSITEIGSKEEFLGFLASFYIDEPEIPQACKTKESQKVYAIPNVLMVFDQDGKSIYSPN